MVRLFHVTQLDADFLRQHLARIFGHVFQGLTKLPNTPAIFVRRISERTREGRGRKKEREREKGKIRERKRGRGRMGKRERRGKLKQEMG